MTPRIPIHRFTSIQTNVHIYFLPIGKIIYQRGAVIEKHVYIFFEPPLQDQDGQDPFLYFFQSPYLFGNIV